MKRYSIIALLTILSSSLYAQDVWTEGTTWDVEYTQESNIPHTLFTLMKAMDIEGVSYFPLTASTTEGCDTIAYIRSECGDSLVFARVIFNGALLQESLLYDFTKSFEYGDIVRYGTLEGIVTEYISTASPVTYLCDVIKEGDCLPVWNDIIYKTGHVEGPLGLFFTEPESEATGGVQPKLTNVSHILFGTRKGMAYTCSGLSTLVCYINNPITIASSLFDSVDKSDCVLYVPAGCADAYKDAGVWNEFKDIREMNSTVAIDNVTIRDNDTADTVCNLRGQKVDDNYKGIVIRNGKKYLMK